MKGWFFMKRKVIYILIAVVVIAGLAAGGYALAQSDDKKADSSKSDTTAKEEVVSKEVKEAKAQTGGGASTVNEKDTAGEPVDPSDYIGDTKEVKIINFKFTPETLTVKKGTTVTWENEDYAEHTITSDGEDGPKSDKLAQNQLFSYKFTKAGTYTYFSDDELKPKGSIVVTE
jgi:plastocyanin